MPADVPFLQRLFTTIGIRESSYERFSDSVNELVSELLAEVGIEAVAHSNQQSNHKDPLSYHHEHFLEQYHPQLRELRGVYYTPEPVVLYIIRSIDRLLRFRFNHQNGLAGISEDMILLDPACGTGIFLQAVIDYIRRAYRERNDPNGWQEYVGLKLLPHLYGLELLPVPYTLAHLNLVIKLAALDLPEAERHIWAYRFQHDEQLHIYLANTLEEVKDTFVQQEQTKAHQVLVMLGNPPFAGHSLNKGQWITSLIDTYKEGCPDLRKPGQAKWLSDDYVKFVRFAQWNIEQAGSGILAFITNHSYLDNPTFRGMRRSLLQTFDDMYILDLHGNRKKHECAPNGSADENVFDIQQGVAIGIFVKWQDFGAGKNSLERDQGQENNGQAQGRGKPRSAISGELARVHHADLWGVREVYRRDAYGQATLVDGKYAWLAAHDLDNTQWTRLNPQAPFYLFTPQESQFLAEYSKGWSLADIFRPGGDSAPGVVTCHDQFAISWTKQEACAKIERFLSTESEAEARQLFHLCSQSQWQYHAAKYELQQDKWQNDITEILYRPFDRRWTIFNRAVAVHRRERVMKHMLRRTNIGLAVGRAGHVIDQKEWDIAFCSSSITDFNLFRRGGHNLFPLYLYDLGETSPCKANLAGAFIEECIMRLGLKWVPCGQGDLADSFGPEDIFAYLYALFYSPAYRKRYAPFLMIDFPRVPITSN
ncbi:MAG TPA: type ISP restriction/modification enzyme, partial [Ktedonobacteraceae bacterium]|nr:type ISP restriction/modification enzyme [Ktedonobacteraceae bacterium]